MLLSPHSPSALARAITEHHCQTICVLFHQQGFCVVASGFLTIVGHGTLIYSGAAVTCSMGKKMLPLGTQPQLDPDSRTCHWDCWPSHSIAFNLESQSQRLADWH